MDGIVVSNHGGRTSDSFPATLDVLSGIVDAVGTEVTVLFDGGIRRGSDIAKALCLGARAVMAGRSPLYGVAADGENGALDVLSLLVDELSRTMAYMGATKIAEIGPANLVLPSVRRQISIEPAPNINRATGASFYLSRLGGSVAPFAGRNEPLMECGARVKAGEVVGLQHDFERIDLDAWPVRAGVDGVVIAQAWGRWCCKASIFWSPGGLRHLRLDAVLPSMFQLLAEA